MLNDLTSKSKIICDQHISFLYFSKYYFYKNESIENLSIISDWAFRWKMNFNPDPNKEAQDVIFSRKVNKINHSPLLFNQNLVKSFSTQKHLRMIIDTNLELHLHLKNVQIKAKQLDFL